MRIYFPILFLLALTVNVLAVPNFLLFESTVFKYDSHFTKFYDRVRAVSIDVGAIWRSFLTSQAQASKYAQELLNDAAKTYRDVPEQVEEFKTTMADIIFKAASLKKEFVKRVNNYELTDGKIATYLSVELDRCVEELKGEFKEPLPKDHTERSQYREKIIDSALDKIEKVLLQLCNNMEIPESESQKMLGDMKIQIRKVLVITGHIIDRHPVLMESLLFAGIALLIPESWILRPIFSVFGFGPMGPIKGSPAAWMQRTFWGGFVKEGSWFALLQRAGMKLPGIAKPVMGGIGAGIGIIGAKFCS